MTTKIKFCCPHCKKLLRIAARRYEVGISYPCPACGRPVTIPDLDSVEGVPLDEPETRPADPTSWVKLDAITDDDESSQPGYLESGPGPARMGGGTTGPRPRSKATRPSYPDDLDVLPSFPGLFAFAERLDVLLPGRRVTLHAFWRLLGLLILLGEGAGLATALLIFVGSTLLAVGVDSPLFAVAGLLGSVAVIGFTYVGSLFARAAVRWVYDTPLTVHEGVVFDAIGILLATGALGMCVMGFVRSIFQLSESLADLGALQVMASGMSGGRIGLFVQGAGMWFLAWVVLRKDLLGLKITELTDGQGSRLLAQAAALWQTVLRLLVLGSVWNFGVNTCVAACTLVLAGLRTVVQTRGDASAGTGPGLEFLAALPAGLALLSGLLAPVGAYLLYVVGSTIPELLILLGRMEFNTRRPSGMQDETV